MSTITPIHTAAVFPAAAEKLDSSVMGMATKGHNQTSGTIPANVLQAFDKSAAGLAPLLPGLAKNAAALKADITTGPPNIDLSKLAAHAKQLETDITERDSQVAYDVAQLDRAEAMAQDAFEKAYVLALEADQSGDPYANYTDQLRVVDEMQQVDQIRKSVEQDLSPLQRQALEHIDVCEQADVSQMGGLPYVPAPDGSGEILAESMEQTAQESKSLDQWIEGLDSFGMVSGKALDDVIKG